MIIEIIRIIEKPYDFKNGDSFIFMFFTPLESLAACPVRSIASIGAYSGDDGFSFFSETGFNAPFDPTRWNFEDFLTGFTR